MTSIVKLTSSGGATIRCKIETIYKYLRKHTDNGDGAMLFQDGENWLLIDEANIYSNLIPSFSKSLKVMMPLELSECTITLIMVVEHEEKYDFHDVRFYLHTSDPNEAALIKTIT